ncbi:flagellar hook-basal body complex protein [Caldithrix abyssi]|nr:flagellar hook-basal body complex protein [Caldithrix abyssi]
MSTQNFDAFATALSGLKAQQAKLEMIGNNIANINTIGYKSSRMTFAEQLGQTIGITYTPFAQGTFQNTGNPTDLGIKGDGFFVIQDGENRFFTRAGAFNFNEEGKLVNSDGYVVQGWMNNINSDVQGATLPGDIVLDMNRLSEAQATQNIWFSGNLNASLARETEVWRTQSTLTIKGNGPAIASTDLNDLDQVVTNLQDGDTIDISGTDASGNNVTATFTYGTANNGTTVADLLNVINSAYGGIATAELVDGQIKLTDTISGNSETTINLKAGASNAGTINLPSFTNSVKGDSPVVTTTMVVYDALGGAHELTVEIEKTEEQGEWHLKVLANGDASIVGQNQGSLSFDANGKFLGYTFDNGESSIIIDPGNGAPQMEIQMNFDGKEGMSGLSHFDSVSTFAIREQDGYETGKFTGYTIDQDGMINGSFSNGQTMKIAQIAVAKFKNSSGLDKISGSIFTDSMASGDAQIGKVDELGSSIHSGVLELSNVDLADQFTKMIEAQRAFQAVSRVLTTLDEVLSETSRLKR